MSRSFPGPPLKVVYTSVATARSSPSPSSSVIAWSSQRTAFGPSGRHPAGGAAASVSRKCEPSTRSTRMSLTSPGAAVNVSVGRASAMSGGGSWRVIVPPAPAGRGR